MMNCLHDELLLEILLRIPDTRTLIRASAACKRWFHLISDPFFLRRFRVLHPPPLLGHLFSNYIAELSMEQCPFDLDCFVPISPSPDPQASRAIQSSVPTIRRLLSGRHGKIEDCRGGRLLLRVDKGHSVPREHVYLAFYNPLSGDFVDIPKPKEFDYSLDCSFMGVAMDIDENDGSFRAVLVWKDNNDFVFVGLFSSNTRNWRVLPSVHLGGRSGWGHVRVGNVLYWLWIDMEEPYQWNNEITSLLALDLRTSRLFHVELPVPHMFQLYEHYEVKIMGSEEHPLRLVAVKNHLLLVWLLREEEEEGGGWVLEKEVDLQASFGRIAGEQLSFQRFISKHWRIEASNGFVFFLGPSAGSAFFLHLQTADMARAKHGNGNFFLYTMAWWPHFFRFFFPYTTPWPPSFPILDTE